MIGFRKAKENEKKSANGKGRNSGLNVIQKKGHMHELAVFRENELRKKPRLHSLFLEMTAACNEHCRHCGSRCGDFAMQGLLSNEEMKGILDQIAEDFDPGSFRLCVTGGEPLMRPDFFDIMDYANRKGFLWGMTSNGTLIDKETALKLKQTGMKTISVSVDGLPETHDWFRQSPGSYEKTMQGIRNLMEVGGFAHVQVTTVVHPKNIDELEEMYAHFKELGIRSWRVINIEPIGRAREQSELMLSAEQYRRMFDFIKEKRFADKMEVTYGCSHYLGPEWEREVRKWYFLCNAGVYTASIMYNGDIGACLDIERRPELIQGNIRRDRFKDVWENRFEVFRTDYRKTGKCAKCKDYEFCAGDSFHTWNFDTMEPYLCMRDILKG